MANEPENLVPPYVGWGVFKSTIDTLADITVPSGPLDRRVLVGLSGANHGALISALRYLGLVDTQRRATNEFRNLVEESKNPDKFREKLMLLLDEKYKRILERVDIESGTISQLEKAFKEDGVTQGQMLTKTIRFFIKAYTEAGYVMSPHITRASPKARATTSKTTSEKVRQAKTKMPPTTPNVLDDVMPAGFSRLPIPGMSDAFIQYPNDLTEQQCAMLDGAIALLRIFVKGRTGEKET
jgi:hypothetical protein